MKKSGSPHFNSYRRRLGYVLLVFSVLVFVFDYILGNVPLWSWLDSHQFHSVVGVVSLILGLLLIFVHKKRESKTDD
jgi:hypothetical protein